MRGLATAIVLTALICVGLVIEPGRAAPMHRHGHPVADSSDTGFDALMAWSMERMHADMVVPPSGNPDRDFAAMMIPHHQGAIDMAKAELLQGTDPVLRRLAQAIIVEQAQEIAVMHRALDGLPADAIPATPTEHHLHSDAPAPARNKAPIE